MIEAITSEQGRLKDAATAAAAANYLPPIQRSPQVRPDPDLVKSIGFATDADAFRGSSPDLQSLLDSLLANFGTEHDLHDGEAKDLETNYRIRENNDGSREAVDSLQNTSRHGEETVQLDREVEDQRTKFQNKPAEANSEPLVGTAEHRLSAAESDLNQAESLSTRAQSGGDMVGPSDASDEEKLQRSAELFQQKAAAAESAARLHRVMVEKVRRRADQQRLKEQEQKREREALRNLESDTAFSQRLKAMHELLQSLS